MVLLWIGIAVELGVVIVGLAIWSRGRKRRVLKEHTIEAEALREMLEPEARVLLFDVRQPLDVLAYSEMIPGAKRIAPKEVLENPSLIPREQDVVVYCTCPGDKTSWQVLQHARANHIARVKLLRGGLDAWKAKGYSVVPYKESFRLDTAS